MIFKVFLFPGSDCKSKISGRRDVSEETAIKE
jgi:hypothetical protein